MDLSLNLNSMTKFNFIGIEMLTKPRRFKCSPRWKMHQTYTDEERVIGWDRQTDRDFRSSVREPIRSVTTCMCLLGREIIICEIIAKENICTSSCRIFFVAKSTSPTKNDHVKHNLTKSNDKNWDEHHISSNSRLWAVSFIQKYLVF